MNDTQQALVARWSTFLQKIDERLTELMAEAEQGLLGVMADFGDDALPLTNAMSGLDHRVGQLREKIQETWDAQVSDRFADAGGSDFMDVGLDAKADFELHFDETWAAFKGRMQSKFYRDLWTRALASMQKPVTCLKCGGPVPRETPKVSASVPCPHCRAINQIIPEACVQTYYSAAPHAFAEEAALPLRFAVERYRTQVDRERRARNWASESLESLKRWEQMELAYWTRYVEVRGQVLGEPPDQELLKSRMDQFRTCALETHQIYKQAQKAVG